MTLLLMPPPADWKGPVEIISGLSCCPWKRLIEPAGEAYQILMKKLQGFENEEVVQPDDDIPNKDDEQTSKEQREKYEAKRHKKLLSGKLEDPYEIMGLEHLRWKATEDDIKQAYKKLVLKYHPDKNTQIDDEVFKKITSAYDLLSDPRKRKGYDSQEEDDFQIPTSLSENQDFFDVFGPPFVILSKWSVNRDVPSLGNLETPYEQVKKFYDFWFSFKSWRDYSYLDEFHLDEAESREERRWMERQNERERRKMKKEESAKIFKLTESAEKFDPRIRKYKEEQKEARNRAKEEKREQLRKRQEELERQAALEKEKKEEEERIKAEELAAKKKEKVDLNKKLRKERSKFRNLCKAAIAEGFNPLVEDVEKICAAVPLDRLKALNKAFEGTQEEKKAAFYKELELVQKEAQERKDKEAESYQKGKEPKQASKPWTEEELSLLARGLAKFPGGATDRWQQIADLVGTRTIKEIIAKTQETKYVTNKSTVCQVTDPYNKFKSTKKGDSAIYSPLSVRDNGEIAPSSSPASTPKATPDTTPVTTPKETIKDPADWNAEEQKALEAALKACPASLTDRWDKIATMVPGKTKKECIQRYKYLVEQIKQKKGQK